jgi:SET and MYND domain-containing protein
LFASSPTMSATFLAATTTRSCDAAATAAVEPAPKRDPWVARRKGCGRIAIAAKDLEAGTVVSRFSGRPYGACPLPSQRDRLCTGCLRGAEDASGRGADLSRCSRCKWARYCSKACQGNDWKEHKHECAALAGKRSLLRQLPDAACADVLLAGRCLRRRARQEAAALPAESSDAAFDALEPGVPSEADMELGRIAASTPGLLPPPPSEHGTAERAAALIAAFGRNNFGLLNDVLVCVGAGCYPDAAILNHSCQPSCVLAFDGATLEVRTARSVAAGEELTHSYVDLCLSTLKRREVLRERYGFDCVCRRCEVGLPRIGSGEVVEDLLCTDIPAAGGGGGGASTASCAATELARSIELLQRAAHTEDDDAELSLLREATKLRLARCHPLSALVYEAETRTLTTALACGHVEEARQCCRAAVRFLEMALGGVPSHPLLALQRFTLVDLALACAEREGDEDAAREAGQEALREMRLCAAAIQVSAATRSALREQATARLEELEAAILRRTV